MKTEESYTAFAGSERVAGGDLAHVAQFAKAIVDAREPRTILVFSDQTGRQVDLDLRGSMEDVLARHAVTDSDKPAASSSPRKPGRPKLGVVGREVTLLPRHWEWLNIQPGGASVVLRKLVEQALRGHKSQDQTRLAREAAYRFMSAMAGNEPGFEEACRGLFAGNREVFFKQTRDWPIAVRDFARQLATAAFDPGT